MITQRDLSCRLRQGPSGLPNIWDPRDRSINRMVVEHFILKQDLRFSRLTRARIAAPTELLSINTTEHQVEKRTPSQSRSVHITISLRPSPCMEVRLSPPYRESSSKHWATMDFSTVKDVVRPEWLAKVNAPPIHDSPPRTWLSIRDCKSSLWMQARSFGLANYFQVKKLFDHLTEM